MLVKSICPKCGREGTQSIWSPNKKSPHLKYLAFSHGSKDVCYIGRVRTTEEAMGEFNKPETREDYKVAFKEITKDLGDLVDYYSRLKVTKTPNSTSTIISKLQSLLNKYGY